MKEMHLVKRKGHTEKFDQKKAYASVYWACRSSHLSEQEAELLAEKIMKSLSQWLEEKQNISSNQIFQFIGHELSKLNSDAGYMYKTRRDLS